MLKKLKENILEWIKSLEPKTILLCLVLFLASSLVMGTLLRFIFENIASTMVDASWHFRARLLIEWQTWLLGAVVVCFLFILFADRKLHWFDEVKKDDVEQFNSRRTVKNDQ